ncbi:hypothetical protein [Bradyrhizobium diazoefficiens]
MNVHHPHAPGSHPIVVDGETTGKGPVPQITLITKSDVPPLLSKRISLDADGHLNSDGSGCLMSAGSAARVFVETAGALARIIAECRHDQAIALGALREDLPDSVAVTIPSKLAKQPGAITRSRSYIDYRAGVPAWCLIDFDSKGMPSEIQRRIDEAGGMWNTLLEVAPELAKAARVSRASTTAGLFRSDTNQQIAGSNGMHHYVLVRDGADIERLLKDLHDRCWLHGLGWHLISARGDLLDRSIVDRMVGYGERLCFEGAPVVFAPLAQDQAKRVPQSVEGKPLESSSVAPQLSEYERHLVSEAKAASAKALGKSAAQLRSRHDKELADKISAKSGAPYVTALRLVEARHRGVLFPDVELEFDHLGAVTVEALLAEPDRYVGETLADPLEGSNYGRCKAKVMLGDEGDLLIHSFAHGRGLYFLRHDLSSAKKALLRGADSATVELAVAILNKAEIEEDELDDFATFVSNATGVGIRAVKARFKKSQASREAKARAAALKSQANGRIVRARPENDGELRPTVMFLDDLLAKDTAEEPPMRNALGAIVRVEEREPWGALHLLTSGSSNATTEEENIKAPAEPIIVELTPTGVELTIEERVCWTCRRRDGSTYFGATPRPHVVALMEYKSSSMPIVRAINTSPLVTASGRVLDGVGLDRSTGLFHRIDPLLRDCVPAGVPSNEEVRGALSYLLDEWFVDVALDRVGKCVAVILALTVLQRALLPERPAFFVTAGQRGGGKTTLVTMIIMAILGRRPAAAGWSSSAEERKKALFSYLRQGVAAVIWDNIPRGATISCPHIEAALTATETSDRVLGDSVIERVAATTIQLFTGNSIAPLGDLASRSFKISLNVERPDPENRNFKHADPLTWSQANRSKILRSLYTILIAGALRRPQEQEAKTRFKKWWTLIGWPMEHAAGLLDIELDCTQLMRDAESEEEEASATSRVLTVLAEQWGRRWFTTKDVAFLLSERNSRLDEEKAARAEALFDALIDLNGKNLEDPIARSLGKVFQKHLTDRPVLLEAENCVATLRKLEPDKNKDGNKYEIVLRR